MPLISIYFLLYIQELNIKPFSFLFFFTVLIYVPLAVFQETFFYERIPKTGTNINLKVQDLVSREDE